MKDYFGRDIQYGDYICYPHIVGNKLITMSIKRVIRFNKKTIRCVYPNWCGMKQESFIRHPERAIVISKELALEKQPLFMKM